MMKIFLLTLITSLACFDTPDGSQGMSRQARKKMDATLRAAYGADTLSLIALMPDPQPGGIDIHRVMQGDDPLGYVVFGTATGRYEQFDYMVAYTPDCIIQKVEILEYRSDRGVEITGKRWLAQFQGLDGCRLEYGRNIDAIAGATLSGRALVQSISENCEQIKMIATFDLPKP